ncbi:MAG: NeuD/PglB/VioB family sugar acetyltransferase [Candidatus Nitrotoga sp.]
MVGKRICIIGAGGLGQSVLSLMEMMGRREEVVAFAEEDDFLVIRTLDGLPVVSLSVAKDKGWSFILAIGSSAARDGVARRLGRGVKFDSCIHNSAVIMGQGKLGEGAIVFPLAYISRNSRIGRHTVIMPGAVIGHDVIIGDAFTASPNVSIGGYACIGNRVLCGLSACFRDRISVTDDVTVGMGAVVVRDISRPGIYTGNPARLSPAGISEASQ